MPEFAQVRRWPSCEVNGLILVWFHCDGKDPEWTVPEYEEITNGKWVYRGRTEHFINAHIQVGVHVCKRFNMKNGACDLLVYSTSRKSLKMQQTWPTWVTCTRRAWRAALICATPTAKPGNSCDTTGRWASGLMFKMDTACRYSFLKAESPVPPPPAGTADCSGELPYYYVLLILFVLITRNMCSLKARWEPESEPNQHCSQMFVKHSLTLFGLHCPLLDVNVVARQVKLMIVHFALWLTHELGILRHNLFHFFIYSFLKTSYPVAVAGALLGESHMTVLVCCESTSSGTVNGRMWTVPISIVGDRKWNKYTRILC